MGGLDPGAGTLRRWSESPGCSFLCPSEARPSAGEARRSHPPASGHRSPFWCWPSLVKQLYRVKPEALAVVGGKDPCLVVIPGTVR